MVATADSTFDLGILEIGLLFLHFALVLGAGLPVCDGSEDDVLGNAGGVGLGAGGLALLHSEF